MSVRVSVRPSVRPSGSPSARFPHFSPTCFDILSWNFAHAFFLMNYRSSSSVVTLRHYLKELCLFENLEYRKYTVFRSFLLHALTYWPEILHMTLFWCTTDTLRQYFTINFTVSWNLTEIAIFWPFLGTFLFITLKLFMLEEKQNCHLKVQFISFSMV